MPWYTHIEVELTGRATRGAAPVDLTLEIYDGGALVAQGSESGVELGREYSIPLILGSPAGNAAQLNVGEHSLQGRLLLRNPEGEVTYETDTVIFGIGVVPTGEVF